MQYLRPTFTLPACGNRVTQEQWDRIFGCPECGKVGFHKMSCDTRGFSSVENKEVTDPQIAPGFDMSGPSWFDTPEYVPLSQADGWASDGQMAGGTREKV